MANPNGNPSNLTPFRPGQSGNPGGKPKGARNRLEAEILRDLAEDYRQHGRAAIQRLFEKDPAAYLRVTASLIPKQQAPQDPLDQLSREEVRFLFDLIDKFQTWQEARAVEGPALSESQSSRTSRTTVNP